ncbi:tetratricopeptide repeat protein [Streptomyces sp. NPDC001595]|uniref:tetratricopeptide repeat protein n=1 Tax=Streptomyces sp. NPDC001532 TaxID=3154520 RepID=UPI00332DBD60
MNVDDLEWQTKFLGGVSPRLVNDLLERGHLDLVIRAASERGEWFCAEAAVRELCGAGEFERAHAVMEPFVAAGWRPAVWATAEILLHRGRTEEALDLVRPDEADPPSDHVCHSFAELLAAAGRVDEAIELLRPRLGGWWLTSCLVEVTEGRDRDDQVLELLGPLAESARQARGQARWNHPCPSAQELQAQVLERAGRADEAIRILGADIAAGRYLVRNTLTAYAELLVRHGRIDELRELGTGKHAGVVLPYYAQALEQQGRAVEAEAVLREFMDAAEDPDGFRRPLIELLARQGRLEEAVEVGRPTFDCHDACLLEGVVHLLYEAGRLDEAVAVLDERSTEFVEEHSSWWALNRLWLLGEAGRYEEALAFAATLPSGEYGVAETTAWLMGESGRVEEAIDLLRDSGNDVEAAELLVRHGRAAEAIAGLPSLSELREAARRRDAALEAARGPGDDPF